MVSIKWAVEKSKNGFLDSGMGQPSQTLPSLKILPIAMLWSYGAF